MKSSTTSLLTIVAIFAIFVIHYADATVETTCKAAADRDKRINYNFCIIELSRSNDSIYADTWGLAKVAALIGESKANMAMDDIKVLLNKKGTAPKTKVILGQCLKLYDSAAYAFADAWDELNDRNYMRAKGKVELATPLAHKCDDVFTKAAISSPLIQDSRYTAQIAIICITIINLIK